jgi:hypothetical protein
MPDIVSTNLFDHRDTNPGSRAHHTGRMHPVSVWDHLPLPGNITVGRVDTDRLRGIFHRLGVPDSHHLGRDRLCERYSEMLHKIGNEAKNRAIEAWLESKRD